MQRILIFLLPFIVSCSNIIEDNEGVVLARAFDKYLYERELTGVIPPGTPPDDSIAMAKSFIDNWVRQQLVLHQAEKNLTHEELDFQQQLEAYKNSLVIFEFESNLIRQKLDTVVTDEEVKRYYLENQSNFELKENILKVRYVKLDIIDESIGQVKRWISSSNPDDRDKLGMFCADIAINYFLNDETWLYFNDLLKEIPLKSYNQEAYLRSNNIIEIRDENFIYLLFIVDFKLKEGISPLSLESNNIKSIIMNRRKISMIKEMRESLYKEGLNRGDFEIYVPGPLQ